MAVDKKKREQRRKIKLQDNIRKQRGREIALLPLPIESGIIFLVLEEINKN